MLRRNDNGKIICDRPDCLCHTDQEQHNILTPDQPNAMAKAIHAQDGTAGHSKGNWYYFGETFVGILSNCQHPLTPPVKMTGVTATKEEFTVIVSHSHEKDIIIPGTDEGDFEQLMDDICDDSIDFNQYRSNLRLMALAQHAPHDCGDPECPGVINKRKLELYDRFQECIKGFAEAGLLT